MKPYRSEATKKEEVRTMFDRISPAYDLLNHTLSFGIDRIWRRRTVRIVARSNPRRILDVAAGTGDLTLMMARRMPDAHVTGIDLSEGMLARAREKAARKRCGSRIDFACGEAERLPYADGSFDAVTAAFGVRNFEELQTGLRQMARVLRPGGTVTILEFSTPRNRLWGALYGLYAHRLLPLIGGAVSHDRQAYAYLPASVDEFPSPARFLELLAQSGFESCRARSQSGGVAQIYTGIRCRE